MDNARRLLLRVKIFNISLQSCTSLGFVELTSITTSLTKRPHCFARNLAPSLLRLTALLSQLFNWNTTLCQSFGWKRLFLQVLHTEDARSLSFKLKYEKISTIIMLGKLLHNPQLSPSITCLRYLCHLLLPTSRKKTLDREIVFLLTFKCRLVDWEHNLLKILEFNHYGIKLVQDLTNVILLIMYFAFSSIDRFVYLCSKI